MSTALRHDPTARDLASPGLEPPPWLQPLHTLPDRPLSPSRGAYTLTMRECQGAEEALALLAAEARTPGEGMRLHLGWGSFRNLDVIAARRSDRALLLDINRHQLDAWLAVRSALLEAGDAEAFIDGLVPRLPQAPRAPRLRQFADATPAATRRWLRGDLERPGSWLFAGAPERFAHVRERFAAAAVGIGCVDLRSGDGCAALTAALRAPGAEAGVRLDTVYLSNIPWMLAQPLGFFGESHGVATGHDGAPVLDRVHAHLSALLDGARHVLSAMTLRADATPDDLQWRTELLPAARFLADPAWIELRRAPPAAG